ncbi:MAG TPA: glycosyltransferase [Kamptonema sp.]|nr:glycosyltransferase [Kamptonema sp.]
MKILTAGDKNYIPGIAALLKSLELNLKKDENQEVEITIVSTGISNKEKQQLEACCNYQIYWKDFIGVDDGLLSLYGSKLTYVRLEPEKYVNAEDRLLWIDGDTIVLGDLEPLWTMNLEGMAIASALNPWGNPNNSKDKNPYFNTGVLVYNMKVWREEKLSEKLMEDAKINVWSDHDQGALNSLLRGRCKKLERIWNNENTEDRSTRIMHFMSKPKPWESPTPNQMWVEIFSQTPFKDELQKMQARSQGWLSKFKLKYGKWYVWLREPMVKFKSYQNKKKRNET